MEELTLKKFIEDNLETIIQPFQDVDLIGCFLHGSYNRKYFNPDESDIDLEFIHVSKHSHIDIGKIQFKIEIQGITIDVISISKELALEGIEHSEFEISEYLKKPVKIFDEENYQELLKEFNENYKIDNHIKSIINCLKFDVRKGQFEDKREIDRIDYYLDEIFRLHIGESKCQDMGFKS